MIAEILADPAEMIAHGAPHLIHNDMELKHYTEALFALTAKPKPTRAELDAIDLLSLLIQTYEAKHRTPPKAKPAEVLKFLMDQHGLKQQDLTPELGSVATISLILAGKRNLTIAHMHALGKRFHVPPSVFLGDVGERAA